MRDYDKNKESAYLKYWNENNLNDNDFKKKTVMKRKMKDFFLKFNNVQYSEKLHELNNILPFLPERVKLEKVEKLVANLRDKTEYVIHIRNLKQALNHGLILTKVHRVIKFN